MTFVCRWTLTIKCLEYLTAEIKHTSARARVVLPNTLKYERQQCVAALPAAAHLFGNEWTVQERTNYFELKSTEPLAESWRRKSYEVHFNIQLLSSVKC